MIHLHTFPTGGNPPIGPSNGDGKATMCFPFRWDEGENLDLAPFNNVEKAVAHFAYWNWTQFNATLTYTTSGASGSSKTFNFLVSRHFAENLDRKTQIKLGTPDVFNWSGSHEIEDGADLYTAGVTLSFFREHQIGNNIETAVNVPPMFVKNDGTLWRPTFVCDATVDIQAGAEYNITMTSFIDPEDTTDYEFGFYGNLAANQFGYFAMFGHSGLDTAPLTNASLTLIPKPETFINWAT